MKNFQNLLLQDVQQHLHSFKFVVVLVFACLISGVCVCINILDFNDRQNNYQTEVTRNQDQMKSFRSFGDFKVLIQVPPNPLAIFAKGVENEVGNKVVIEPMEIPLPKKTSEATNPFLAIFSYMDITGIVGLILSLLVLLITTDVISGDKEKHLLKMIFANSVSRTEYLTSKYLGAFLIAGIPLILIFVMTALMCVLFLSAPLNTSFWLGVLSIFGVCLLFLSTFVLFGLLISACSVSSASSAINGLLLWCILVILYPAVINYTVTSYTQKPSELQLEEEIAHIESEFFKHHFNYLKETHHMKPTNTIHGEDFGNNLSQSLFMKFVGITEKFEFERLENNNRDMLPEYFKSRDQVLSLHDQYRHQMLKPEKRSHHFLWFLPNRLMERSNTEIAHTNRNFREVRFSNAVRNYKQTVMNYLTSKNAFGMKFVTLLPIQEMRDDFSEYPEALKQQYMNTDFPTLELNDIPGFPYPEPEGFPIEALILLFVNLLLFGLLYRIFMSVDIT